jgi:hypothetical protein
MVSYVLSLEERVAELENELRSQGTRDQGNDLYLDDREQSTQTQTRGLEELSEHVPSTNDAESDQAVGRIVTESMHATIESLSEKVHVGTSSGIFFTRLLLSELDWTRQNLSTRYVLRSPGLDAVSLAAPQDSTALPVSLPDRHSAESMIRIYFELANFTLPGLTFHEPSFRQRFALVYDQDRSCDAITTKKRKMAVVFCYLVFAIALLALQKRNSESVSLSLCGQYHDSALLVLQEVGLARDIDSVQALLLLVNYSYLHPSFLGTWKTVGMATRLVVELGLHEDPPVDSVTALELDIRRRVFWVTYSMDRNVGIYLGRPFGLADGAISAEVCSIHWNRP